MKNPGEFISERFLVRAVTDTDKDYMKAVAEAEYLFGHIYVVDPEIGIKVYWEEIVKVSDDQNYIVFLNSGELIGRVALQGIHKDTPELAIVIVKEQQSKGYGYLLLKQWLNWVHQEAGYKRINIRIDSENKKSIALFKKLGAVIDDEADIICCHINMPIT